MKQLTTQGIVLRRTDFGEADRIVTLLTPDHGKLSLMARGVRRSKSKLAGGIELFSTSDIVYIRGKGDLGTLISARLITHYGKIVSDLPRVQLGYDIIALLNTSTEDEPESDYYDLLEAAFKALNNTVINLALVRIWFEAQLLRINGHTPNLQTDAAGQQLTAAQQYNFDVDTMAFIAHDNGRYDTNSIKVLRLLFSNCDVVIINKVQGIGGLLDDVALLVRTLTHL